MAAAQLSNFTNVSEREYKRRIWAWTMYDWANSAFATTVLAAVLPVYFSQVAGATLPSATVATTYWSYGLSASLLVIAVLSPILGTISDILRGKKLFLAIFAGIGIISTALLVLVNTGDWVLASVLGIVGRIGFNGSITFYDSLLPHVAREDDRDRVSARGYALGYLGGGLLLAVNILMIQFLPGTLGARLSFLSVAIWWGVFAIPLFIHVPEPHTGPARQGQVFSVVGASFRRMAHTLRDMRQYRELFKYLVAFLIYNDGIGTIISIAAIYGAELGFGSIELILALLLVQFVGIPYSLIFGRLPSQEDRRRPFYLAFVLFNLIALPIFAVLAAHTLPANITGAPPARFENTANAHGEGSYLIASLPGALSGAWEERRVSASVLGAETDALYFQSDESGAQFTFPFNGQKVRLTFSQGPESGVWAVLIDGQPLIDPETNQPITLDAYSPTVRYDVTTTFQVDTPGEHQLTLQNTAQTNPSSQGNSLAISKVENLPGIRRSNLGLIIGMIVAVELVGLGLSAWIGPRFLPGLARTMNTQRSLLLSLLIYTIIAILGFFLNSLVEFWFLAWMVAIVQGGSQALSRSLYASLSPASKSGEFFGMFGIMEKFSSIIGPLLFAAAGILFGSSRPAVLSLIILFFAGGYMLSRVNVAEGRRLAQEEDAAILGGTAEA